MFDADRPIQKSDQDRLGRSVFAKYLARCILDHQNPESFVIGLYGATATGKTSIINLTLEELNAASNNMLDNEKPIILNFSPWSYSGQNQLIYAFFRRLSSVILQAPFLDEDLQGKIIYLLELYISFFTHKPIPRACRPKKSFLKKILHPFLTREDAFGWESGRDLTQVKAELNSVLTSQKHKLIIIIDNIARIEKNEIKQIFQIVKSMGDYCNTIYLLSLNKELIAKTLGEESSDYFEKIVQLPFEVPAISKQDLENILFDRLKNIILLVPEETWDREYWADLYYSTLKFFFESCRDITRYINTLNFGFTRVKELVNPVDFFTLTALNVFEPEVYDGIRDNKDLFTDLVAQVYHLDQTKIAEDRIRCDEILSRAKKLPAEMLQQLLTRLFPRLHSLYTPEIPFYHDEALARKNNRICCADLFDIYFRLSISSGNISDSEMDALLSATADREGFALSLLRLNQDKRIERFLDRLDGVATLKIATENIPHVIDALIDSGDMFPTGDNSPVTLNAAMHIHRIIKQLLRRISDPEKRFVVFHEAIKKSVNSIYTIIHELNEQSKQHYETEDTVVPIEEQDFTKEQFNLLQKTTVEKIATWAKQHRLVEHPKLLEILYAWRDFGGNHTCKEYVKKITAKDPTLVTFLCAALRKPINETMQKLQRTAASEESLKHINDFISAKSIEARAKEIFEDPYFEKLSEEQQLAILIFLDLMKVETLKIIPKTTAS